MNPRKNKNIPENDCLPYKQQQAVMELLKTSHKSYEEVAEALGVISRCLYNWRQEPKFKEALKNGIDELKGRVLTAAEFSVQLDSMNSMLNYESKVLDAINIREAIVTIMENQEKLRLEVKAIMKEVELLNGRKL